jgi:glyoxylase-like metal-dependent hydrolase (beta-lactamase superfamily II)/rhodanese-related sulfurtransferase
MKIEQLYTKCLSEAAYYIESEGEVAIIDPMREVEPYLKMAEENGDTIKYIFETHFHADFVSGHIDLANKTGAEIIYGPTAKTDYKVTVAQDGQEFKLGAATFKVLHTPGHTLESTCFILRDEDGKDKALFSGDTLFIGDVGRPDLAVKSDLTKEDLAGMLFDSLATKIKPLANDVVVYPAHGAGSSCGKNLSKETFDLLGNQKENNYALQLTSKDEFVRQLTEGILPPPQYFPKNAMLNMRGYKSIDDVMESAHNPLSLHQFKTYRDNGILILDTRHQNDFVRAFVPSSMFIGLGGAFATWLGTLVEDMDAPIVLITEVGMEEEAVLRCARVGYNNVLGFLDGGFETWSNAGERTDSFESIPAEEFSKRHGTGNLVTLDVRKEKEYNLSHVTGAKLFSLDFIGGNLNEISKENNYLVHCAGGYRSVIACSLMKKAGINSVIDISGGYESIKQTDVVMEETVCPSTL